MAELVPICQQHLIALQDDLVQRSLIPRPRPLRVGPPRPKVSRPSLVYYLRLESGLIKIGSTTSPARRWYRLAHELGPLSVLAAESGGQELELQRHAQFVKLRAGATELFREDEQLARHIDQLCHSNPEWWENVVLPIHSQTSPKGRGKLALNYT